MTRFSLFLFCALSVLANAAPPPLKDFAEPHFVRQLALSPDGKHVAVTTPNRFGGLSLGVINVETSKMVAGGTLGASSGSFTRFMWVGNQYVVASLGQRFGAAEAPLNTGELVALKVGSKSLKYLFGYRGEQKLASRIEQPGNDRGFATLLTSDDDDGVLLQIQGFENEVTQLFRIDVRNGRRKLISRAPTKNVDFVVDNAKQPRLAHGGPTFADQQTYYKVGSNWEPFKLRWPTSIKLNPIRFAADDRHFYAYGAENKGTRELLRVDIETGSATSIYRGKDGDFVPAASTFDNQDLAAVITQEGIPTVHWLDPKSAEAELSAAVAASLPGHLVLPISASRDGMSVMFEAFSDRNPGDFFYYDRNTNEARAFMSRAEWLPIDALAPVESFDFTSRDGLKIMGFLTIPTTTDGPFPLIMMPHGGPYNVADDWAYDEWSQVLASRGYAVARVNFRGSAGRGRSFTEAGFRQWGLAMQDDLTDATEFLKKDPRIVGKQIGIVGASYGGYAATMGMVKEPELYRCAISYVGVSDLRLLLSRGDIEDSIWGASYLTAVLGSDKAALYAQSPISGLDRVKGPIMVVHGGIDQRVPIAHGTSLRDGLKKAGKSVEWLEKAREGHGFVDPENVVEFYEKSLDFLNRCVKAEKTS